MRQSHLLILTIVFSPLLAVGQDKVEVKKVFFDSLGNRVDSANYFYYEAGIRTKTGDVTKYKEESNYANGKRRVMIRDLANGSYRTLFYSTGQTMAQGAYQGPKPTGPFKLYYRNGKPLAELTMNREISNPKSDLTFQIINYWDETGKQIVAGGNGSGVLDFPIFRNELAPGKGAVVNGLKNGEWTGSFNGATYTETYDNGSLVSGSGVRNNSEYRYKVLNEDAKTEPLLKHIRKNISVPENVMRNSSDNGRLFVAFNVQVDGTITDGEIVKSPSPELSTIVLKLFQSTPGIEPARHRGLPVVQKVVLPLSLD